MLIRREYFVLIMALFFINFFEMGVVKSFGVLLVDMAFQFDTDYATLGIIIGTYHGVTYFIAPFISPIVKELKVSVLCFICVIGSLSLSLVCLTTNVILLSLLCLISGICYAFVRLSGVLLCYKHVKDNFALNFGIADSGNAIGMIVIPILAEFLLEVYSWRGTILILGGLLLHNSIFLLFLDGHRAGIEESDYSAVEDSRHEAIDVEPEDVAIANLEVTGSDSEENLIGKPPSKQPNAFCTSVRKCLRYGYDTFGFSLLVEMKWTSVIMFYQLVTGMVNTAWIVFLVPHGAAKGFPLSAAKGFPLSKAVLLAGFGGLGNVTGRLFQGVVIDRGWLSSLDLTIVLTVVNAVVFLVDPWIQLFSLLAVAAFLGGLTIGARTTLSVVLIKDLFPSAFSSLYGLQCFFYSIGEPLGGLLAGWLSSALSFSGAFMVLGGIEILTCLIFIPSRYFLKERTDA